MILQPKQSLLAQQDGKVLHLRKAERVGGIYCMLMLHTCVWLYHTFHEVRLTTTMLAA